MADEIILEVVEHGGRLVKHFAADAAAEQHALRAEHLGHLGQHGRAAARDHHIAERAHGRVCGHAGQAVRAAALHADDKVADRDRLAAELRRIRRALLKQRAPGRKLVLHILTGQELDAVCVIGAEFLEELVVLQILAPEAEHEHRTRVRMAHKRRKQLAGLRMVRAGLRAAVGMREGVQAVDRPGHQILIVPHHLLGHIVDAAHGRDDPDLVAHRCAAVLAAVAEEGLRLNSRHGRHIRLIGVFLLAGEVGFHVVGVHPRAGIHRGRGMADRITVFDDCRAFRNRLERDFMPLRDVLRRSDGHIACLQGLALADRMQRNGYVIPLSDSDQFCHMPSPYYRQEANAASAPSVRIFPRSASTAASKPSIAVRS